MILKPIDMMLEQVERSRQESEAALFMSLMYLGEMVLKMTVCGIVSGVADDRDRNRYRELHSLVRASGIGDWSAAIDDVLTGPASQSLILALKEEQKELTHRFGPDSWQYDSVQMLKKCLDLMNFENDEMTEKIDARRWFGDFKKLRNKTRGHGAVPHDKYSLINPNLEKFIGLLVENFCLFRRPWAHLRRNLSGKYKVMGLTPDCLAFNYLTSNNNVDLSEGTFIYFDEPVFVDFMYSP